MLLRDEVTYEALNNVVRDGKPFFDKNLDALIRSKLNSY